MPPRTLDQLGDEIAELSVHLEAATARLLDLIREFDTRGGLEQRLPLVRPLARLARGPRPGRGTRARPCGARAGEAAEAGGGARARRALLRQGAGADSRGHARDGRAPAGDRPRRHGGARRAHRARLAVRGPSGRGPGDRGSAREPGAACVSRRGRYRGRPRAAGARGRRDADAGADRRARGALQAGQRGSARRRTFPRKRRPWLSGRPTRWC